MTNDKILKLIESDEGIKTEFKPSLADRDRIVEIVCSFANTKGGVVLVGVSNKGKVQGLDIGRQTIEGLTNTIIDNLDPKIYPEIKRHKIDKKNVISIEVAESSDKPHLAFGKAFIRVGKNSKPMGRGEYEKQLVSKNKDKLHFDSQICKDAKLTDIDKIGLNRFIKEARRQRGLKISEGGKTGDILKQLKLIQSGKLTNAALLLFGKEPKFLQAEVKCIRFKGNKPVKPYIDFQTIEGNIFDLVDRSLDFVLRNIKKSIWLVPGQAQREEKYEYPPDAIREAIVNAIVHRNYWSPSKVQVRVFDDYIEIWNPGNLPEGWTVENLKRKHESVPKNPLLFKQLFWVKYVEDVGGGTIDIIDECKEWGLAEPDFEHTGTSLIVTLKKSIITDEYLDSLELNERQKKAIEYIREKGSISRREYVDIVNVSPRQANKDIKDLLEKKVIIQIGRGRGVRYKAYDSAR